MSELSRARKAVAAFAGAGIGDTGLSRTILSIDEALSNIIEHGYRGAGGKILLTMREEEDMFVFIIEDSAPPFNPLSSPPVDAGEYISHNHDGGLGIDVFRRLTDAGYERTASGNRLILKKAKCPK